MNPEPSQEQGRIVVGVDGSAHSAAALRWALRQAALTGAWVDAVACWQWPPPADGGFSTASYGYVDLAAPTGDAARASVADAVTDTPHADEVVVQVRVEQGYPAAVLIDAATDADLLVVGSRGHGELRGMMLGSVGLHCATHAPCPVLIVHDVADTP